MLPSLSLSLEPNIAPFSDDTALTYTGLDALTVSQSVAFSQEKLQA